MSDASPTGEGKRGLLQRLRHRLRPRGGDSSLREAIEEIIEEFEESEGDEGDTTPIGSHERLLLTNVLKLRRLTAYDVMVPRADIIAVDVKATVGELLALIDKEGHSRLPIYRDTLDDIVGMVHLKDILPYVHEPERFTLEQVRRDVLIVAPSMLALDLLLEMRRQRRHMALVVDEYGGIDGLVTIEDLVEEIVGEIEDEHDLNVAPLLWRRPDGSVIADARVPIEEFEAKVGPILTDEEREADIDTLGGLVTTLAGRLPARGELFLHPASGISIEVVDADPRRLHRLRLRNLPAPPAPQGNEGEAVPP
ncbi:MAG TPA: hemolysin family protein [Kiloniellales bacterium]|nr:hemolysin family protein [Kiloniellales bacterium]